jgi:suppressor of ftsI
MRVLPTQHLRRLRFRPRIERLEDRLTPAALVEPPVINSVNGVLTATLTETVGPATVGNTVVTNAWTYNSSYVGPTLHANPGDLLDITIVNNLPAGQTSNLHTHGLHVSPLGNGDDVLLEIEPTESNHYQIRIPADHPQGLYWYHPHHHETVNEQIAMGLSGLLVIGRADGGAPELNAFPNTLLALKNALLSGNQITVPPFGNTAQTFTVNGQLNPTLTVQTGTVRLFDVADIGNTAFYTLQVRNSTVLGGGAAQPLLLLAEDGNPFTKVTADPMGGNLGFTPGRRWSFTFQPPAAAATWTIQTSGFLAGGESWPAQVLMTIDFVGANAGQTAPAANTVLTPPNNLFHDLSGAAVPIAAHRTVIFTQTGGLSLINGQTFPNNPVFQPRLGTVEEWTLMNPTAQAHPFHLHQNPQQVITGGAGLLTDQDVINVPAGKTVVIRIEFTDFLGTLVYHCHRVDHEDDGMMALVKILPANPVYALGANPKQKSTVVVTNPVTGTAVATFLAFEKKYKGGVSVAVADVNGDAVYDVIVGRLQGRSEVKVIDGTKLSQVDGNGVILASALLGDFLAYKKSYQGGIFVSAGDTNGDGLSDVITGQASGKKARIRVINATMLPQGTPKKTVSPGALLADFQPFLPKFDGGVRVACGDFNGDGRFEIVAGQGPGSKSHGEIKVFAGMGQALIADLNPFGANFKGGVYVGSGNIKGFGFDDLIVGQGKGNSPMVDIFSTHHAMMMPHTTQLNLMLADSFMATSTKNSGVRVTSLHDNTLLPTFGGNKDDVVTTTGKGDGTVGTIFSRTIPVPP